MHYIDGPGARDIGVTQFSVPWQPRREVSHGFIAQFVIGVARLTYSVAAPILSRFPGMILISAVIATCMLVWVHALIFGFVDAHILGGTALPADYAARWVRSV